jgi:hypothetical protein
MSILQPTRLEKPNAHAVPRGGNGLNEAVSPVNAAEKISRQFVPAKSHGNLFGQNVTATPPGHAECPI